MSGLNAAQRVAGVAVLVLATAATVAPAAHGQGWIEPRPAGAGGDWGIERLRTNVTVRVSGRVAEVEVEEWFRNNGRGLGEGDYVYPLPGEAVFTGYSLYQGDQELRGELMDAARAREIYESIVRAQRDPALIELIGKGLVRARVFPIEPGQTRRIQLRYTQMLDPVGDAVQFRYMAGARHAGHSVITPLPPQRPSVELPRSHVRGSSSEPTPLTFTMIVDDAARYLDASSPTHDVRIERQRGRMVIRPRGELRGDFAVLLPLAERAVGISVVTHRPSGEDGYFMLTLTPGEAAASRVPRDLTVVVDVSGSMSGEKMEQARRAIVQLLATLGPEDRVRLIAFSSGVRHWRDGWTPASRTSLASAREWTDALRADGGTNIHDALAAAFAEPTPATRLPLVVFMTDGLPTNGETRPDRIVSMAEAKRGRARVFAFGVGFDVNTYLLDRLSEAARGTTQYVQPSEDVEEAVSLLAARVRHPVLTDIAIVRGSVNLSEIHPRVLPDLFAGEDLVLFGRYAGSGQSTIGISGRRNGRAERYATTAQFDARSTANDYIPRLWAARRLGDIDRRIRSAQADGAAPRQIEQLIDELRTTALRYGLLSQYSAYLVQEPNMVAAGVPTAQRNIAAAPPPVSGQAAVARAEEARRSREVNSIAQMDAVQQSAAARIDRNSIEVTGTANPSRERVIAGRTFHVREGVWYDTRYVAGSRTVDIEAFSDAYFALIRALPELGLVLREVDSVIAAGRSVSVRIGASGQTTLGDADLRAIVAEFR
jgi:Ca-activated chloride channel homolog